MNEGTVEMLQSVLRDDVGYAISYGPIIIAAIAILIIGWIGGRILGKIVVKLLDSVGLDDILDKTFLGEAIRRSEMTTSRLLDLIARWFVYLISIVAAVDVLNIKMLSELVNRIVLYIPHVVAGLMVLLVGLIVGTIIMSWVRSELTLHEVPFTESVAVICKVIFSIIVIVLAFDQLLVDTTIIYTILAPLMWGTAIGIAISMGIALGWGSKEIVAEYFRKKLDEKSDLGKDTK